jgi:predicted DNA-binding transcriptional regulator YafY
VNRTDRLYALVEDLRASAPRPQSARRLAARYEVSARTIERDILALQESGVPVYAEPGRRGGYAIDKTMTLPPVNFTAAEMVAIAVALARDERTPFAAATRSALRKVLAVAPAAQTAQAAQLIDRVRLVGAARPGQAASVPAAAVDTVAVDTVAVDTVAVDTVAVDTVAVDTVAAAAGGGPAHPAPEGGAVRAGTEGAVTREAMARPRSARERAASRWGGPQPGAVPLVIQDAITVGHVLRLDYRDRHDQVTVREVEPVAFVATRSQWYLLAWCRLRQGSRAFRLDRILAAADTGAPAPPRAYQDLDVDIPDAVISRPDLHV